MAPVIRRARPGDHLLIRELQQEVAALHYEGRPDLFQKEGRYYSEEAFARLLANPDEFIWITVSLTISVPMPMSSVMRIE